MINKFNETEKEQTSSTSLDEIALTLAGSINKVNNRKSKKYLRFMTKLISKMKVKELRLRKSNENSIKGIQKVKQK